MIFMSLNSNTKDATNGAGTAHPSRAPKFTPRFLWGLRCGIDFPVLFLYIFGKISVVCLSCAVNMARFGNVNADEMTSAQNEMLCTKHIIVFSYSVVW